MATSVVYEILNGISEMNEHNHCGMEARCEVGMCVRVCVW